jgi:hypothetical protein
MSLNQTPRIGTCEDLEAIVSQQNAAIEALGNLVQGMDEKLRRYVSLVDIHEVALERGPDGVGRWQSLQLSLSGYHGQVTREKSQVSKNFQVHNEN